MRLLACFAFLAVTFSSCEPGGFNTNLVDGLSSNYNGVIVNTIFVTIGGTAHHGRDVEYGNTLVYNFPNVQTWEATEGLVDMEANIKVEDEDGNVIKEWLGLFDGAYPDGIPAEDAKDFTLSVDLAPPFEPGKSYTIKCLASNRNAEQKITVEHQINITEKEMRLTDGVTTEENGITWEQAHLRVNGQTYDEAKVPYGELLELIIEGADGYQLQDSVYNIALLMTWYDKNGELFSTMRDTFETLEASQLVGRMKLVEPIEPNVEQRWEILFEDLNSTASFKAVVNYTAELQEY